MAKAAAKKPAPKSTAVAVKPKNEVAESNVDMRLMLRQDAGKGVSTATEDNIIPLIYILQAQSKQALKQKPEYIKGAEAGNIWPRGSTILIDGDVGVTVIPAGMLKWWMEWGPERGDGLKGRHEFLDKDPNKGRPSDAEQAVDPKTGNKIWVRGETGNVLVETREHAVLANINGRWSPYVISMSGSNHQCSRAWNGDRLNKRLPPPDDDFVPSAFTFVYTLKTIATANDKGDWYKWAFENGDGDGVEKQTLALEGGVELYRMARALHDAYTAGVKKAADVEDETADDNSNL